MTSNTFTHIACYAEITRDSLLASVAAKQGTIAVPVAAEYDSEMATTVFARDSAKDETQIWNLEKAYWEYVKANDLEKYRALWHDDFVGWPLFSSAPVRKDHITDWITKNRSKGAELQSFSIEQLGRMANHWRHVRTGERERSLALDDVVTWLPSFFFAQ